MVGRDLALDTQRSIHPGGVPMRLVAMAGQRLQGAGAGETRERPVVEGGTGGQVVDVAERLRRLDPAARLLVQPLHPSQPETQGRLRIGIPGDRPERHFQALIPAARLDIGGAHLDAVGRRVLHQLRGAVEAHGQAVEYPTVEGRRLVALEPGGDVDQEREARGVGFREAVFAESLDLLEDALRELPVVAAFEHAVDQFALEGLKAPAPLPRRHGAAQLIRLAGGEARRHHREFDHLLLEDRDAEGAFEHLAHRIARIGHRLLAFAAAQIRMHHVALDRAGADDRDLDHQIVVAGRLEARQHGHLRPRFHLEDAHAVGLLEHGVGLRVLRRDVAHRRRASPVVRHQRQRLADRRQHAEAQDIHLQQTQGFEIVLVPLDDRALLHGGVLDRHQFGERPGGDHEAADMLGQMPREA